MKFCLFSMLLATSLASIPLTAASPQVISGASTVPLNSNGTDDGVSFINQSTNETTLQVPEKSTVNKNKNSDGIITDANGLGNINFTGSEGTTDVHGSVGKASNFMDKINQGAGKVIFYDGVHANSYTFDKSDGHTEFKGNVFLGPAGVIFNATATLRVDKNVTFNGNIFGAGLANFELLDNSTLNGNVDAASVSFVPEGPNITQGATINGNVSTSIIELGSGVLGINGNLDLVGSLNVIKLLEDNAVAIPIPVSGTVTVDGNVSIEYHIPKFHAPREGPYNIVNAGTGGTSGANVNIVTNDVRFFYVGSNVNGNITVTSTRRNAEFSAVSSTGQLFYNMLPIAYEFPNSDLDLIEGQLGFPTVEGYNDALYQIAPNIALAGVGRETFNTTKRFLKTFLEHLSWENSNTFSECTYDDITLWVDGIGNYAHQDNKNGYLGYKVNAWQTSVGIEKSINNQLNAGFGFGYGDTKIRLNKFDNSNNMNTYLALAYVSFDNLYWFFDCGATIARNRYHSTRHINFNTINRTSHAKYFGNEYSGFAVGGYNFCYQGIDITPFCSLIYSHVELNAFNENGADTLNLKLKRQNYNYTQSGLGLTGSYAIDTDFGCIIPEIHTIWLHDFNANPLHVTASFSDVAALGGYYNSNGLEIDQNTWNIGCCLNFLNSSLYNLSLIYDYEASSSYFNHQGMVRLNCFF